MLKYSVSIYIFYFIFMVVLLKINVNKLMNEAQYTENKKKKEINIVQVSVQKARLINLQ